VDQGCLQNGGLPTARLGVWGARCALCEHRLPAAQTPDRYYELQDGVAKFRGIESRCHRAEVFVLQARSPFDVLAVFELTVGK